MRFLVPFFLSLFFLFISCNESEKKSTNKSTSKKSTTKDMNENNLPWWKNANIYEVNIRQYTPEGTFAAFRPHLPRLKEMGVDILWFMPIHPISSKNRKGTLGSYYAISDYRGVNPDFGTIIEFKDIIAEAHELGMKVIMDWVPNHTGFDHIWTEKHPDFYTQDKAGNIKVPSDNQGKLTDWSDVAELNYGNKEMRFAMIEEMKFWVRESDIDGYRCDVAFLVPEDFWPVVRRELNAIKPVFMLAESEEPNHRNSGSFDATYGWSFFHLLNDIAKEEKGVSDLLKWHKKDFHDFGAGFQMSFITNHDENSWNGTVQERLGGAEKALVVLAFTLKGMPLIYSGQEASLDHRLKFFEKDTIDWTNLEKSSFYATLLKLKHNNQALWNGAFGGVFKVIEIEGSLDIFAFEREKNGDKVLVLINLSSKSQTFKLVDNSISGRYNTVFEKKKMDISEGQSFTFAPWEFVVLE